MPPLTSKNQSVDGTGARGQLHDRVNDIPTPCESMLLSFINRRSEKEK